MGIATDCEYHIMQLQSSKIKTGRSEGLLGMKPPMSSTLDVEISFEMTTKQDHLINHTCNVLTFWYSVGII